MSTRLWLRYWLKSNVKGRLRLEWDIYRKRWSLNALFVPKCLSVSKYKNWFVRLKKVQRGGCLWGSSFSWWVHCWSYICSEMIESQHMDSSPEDNLCCTRLFEGERVPQQDTSFALTANSYADMERDWGREMVEKSFLGS